MTANRRALLDLLLSVQNQPWNANRDLMTITGFMSDTEVQAHIDRWSTPPAGKWAKAWEREQTKAVRV